jgi:hypothetical protein
MATSGFTHVSFVVLEASQKIQERRSPLSGSQLFMLFGKIITTGFFKTRLTRLRRLQKRLNSKRFGG